MAVSGRKKSADAVLELFPSILNEMFVKKSLTAFASTELPAP